MARGYLKDPLGGRAGWKKVLDPGGPQPTVIKAYKYVTRQVTHGA